jgi:hypothetical protein
MSGGSFERLKYDSETYDMDVAQSTAPLQYRLDPNFTNRCNLCRPGDIGYVGTQGVSLNTNESLIDVESDLKLLNYRQTRNPMKKFIPNCQTCQTCNKTNGTVCDEGLTDNCPTCNEKQNLHNLPSCPIFTEYSRISNPISTTRGVGLNRFQPLCLNPQDINRWEMPMETGINYRLVAKDNHVPCVPKLIDQSSSLPH